MLAWLMRCCQFCFLPGEFRAQHSRNISFTWKLSPWSHHVLALLCFCLSQCWWPCKVAFEKWKVIGLRWHKRVKEMVALALSLGRPLLTLGLGMGCPHCQDSSFLVLENCYAMYFDLPCMQIYEFTIISGRIVVWHGCSKQNCIFTFKIW